MSIVALGYRAVATALRGLASPLLFAAKLLVSVAKPILWASRACMDRAREWDPRLWERDQDPRSDNRERLP